MKLNECDHVCESIADSIEKAKEYGLNQIPIYVILLEDVLDLLNEHATLKRLRDAVEKLPEHHREFYGLNVLLAGGK